MTTSTPAPGHTLDLVVARRRMEAQDIASFELRRADGGPLPPFSAGAHVDVTAPNGMVRQYSLCNAPAERHRYTIAVLRDPASRGASRAIVDELREGDTVRVGAPRNHFALVPARRTLLLAGGIGITPLMSMAEQLRGAGADFVLHYCARSPGRAAFRQHLTEHLGGHVLLHFDDGPAAQRLDFDALLAQPDGGTHVYVCGPAGFIGAVRAAAARHGWPQAQLHVEHFGAGAAGPAAPERSASGGFDVRIASSGRLIHVAACRSVAAALQDAGIALPLSCGEGVCGSCITRVLEGTPDHKDEFFSDTEKARSDRFLPCCSRSLSPVLVLDL